MLQHGWTSKTMCWKNSVTSLITIPLQILGRIGKYIKTNIGSCLVMGVVGDRMEGELLIDTLFLSVVIKNIVKVIMVIDYNSVNTHFK